MFCHAQIDYILWTGDLPAHDIWNQSQEGQVSILFRLSDIFQKYFPGIPVFPAVGNHDTLPVDRYCMILVAMFF